MKSKIILFLLFSISSNAQLIKPFFGLGWGVNTEFENNGIGNISSGVEFSFLKYVKPEIEIAYFFGSAQEDTKTDNQYIATNLFDAGFTALSFSFSPKIIWKQEEGSNSFIQIMPKYCVARVEAIGNYYNINKNDSNISLAEREVLKDIEQAFGIGIGFCIGVSEKDTDAIALNLYYNNSDLGGLMNELKHSSGQNSTKNIFSFGINYYFGTKKK
jgi:hypothetical protein